VRRAGSQSRERIVEQARQCRERRAAEARGEVWMPPTLTLVEAVDPAPAPEPAETPAEAPQLVGAAGEHVRQLAQAEMTAGKYKTLAEAISAVLADHPELARVAVEAA
jgi:hypothetical protein